MNDIILLLQDHVRDWSIVQLLSTCHDLHAYQAYMIHRKQCARNMKIIHCCENQISHVKRYDYDERDVCQKLKLICFHEAENSMVRLPSRLKKLCLELYSTNDAHMTLYQIENKITNLKLCFSGIALSFTLGSSLNIQLIPSYNNKPNMLFIQLPEQLCKLSVRCNLYFMEFQLLHVHTLCIKNFPANLIPGFPHLKVLKIRVMNQTTSLPSTLNKLIVRHVNAMQNIQLSFWPENLQILHIHNSDANIILALPAHLKELYIDALDLQLSCAWPNTLIRLHQALRDVNHINASSLPDTLTILKFVIYGSHQTMSTFTFDRLPSSLLRLTAKYIQVQFNCQLPANLYYLDVRDSHFDHSLKTDQLRILRAHTINTCVPSQLIKLSVNILNDHRLPDTLRKLVIYMSCQEILNWPFRLIYFKCENYKYDIPNHVICVR